ncbi:hypothetical protein ARMSODRAFT_1013932 [Armillaria solidipes]|uniref:Uncharacterized protein n=1 Tax=Armillaria solidipes TaxID=1076256 RepID=A0A2H3BZC7_9AGAR|nr:hypothetical protein ARMSODRAFT_1013932 [Armillaria solidipes]
MPPKRFSNALPHRNSPKQVARGPDVKVTTTRGSIKYQTLYDYSLNPQVPRILDTSIMFSLKQSVIAALALSAGMVNAFTGDATWYLPNGRVVACGAPLQNVDDVVALSSNRYAGGVHCWKHIGGKFVDVTIGDLVVRIPEARGSR